MSDPIPTRRHLPNELMLEIFAILSKERGTLFNLLFLHPSYQSIVERILYRSMTDWLHLESHTRFLQIVKHNPRLASYVRQYALIEELGIGDPTYDARTITVVWDDVVAAVYNMSNLEDFRLLIYDFYDQKVPHSKLLSALQFKRLQFFSWNTPCQGLLALLESQPHLIDLAIAMTPSNDNIQPDTVVALPNLRRLTVNWAALDFISRGNDRIRCLDLRLRYGDVFRLPGRPSFLKPMPNILSLILHDFYRSRKHFVLNTIPICCPSLICLQIPLKTNYLEQATQVNFPRLKYLIFHGADSKTSIESTKFITLFSVSTSLQAIYTGPFAEDTDEELVLEPSYVSRDALDYENTFCCWKKGDTAGDSTSTEAVSEVVLDGLVSFNTSSYEDLPHMLLGD